jgi:Tol biopolymer transport system component/tRNA A-37 threonylcarbamoyl transferase component Bud32
MPLSAGDRLGPYEILAPIGSGGMGEVYRARDTRLGRDVAIKISHEKFTERFEREARTIATLNHPKICTLHDVGPDYLVMELIEGAPLKGPLPLDQALKFASQILDALDAAHQKGITHRDLKPANIVVTKTGIKLLDFGLAKVGHAAEPVADNVKDGTKDTTLTMALTGRNEIVGTLYYMSPEQLQEQATGNEVDARSDIFSFGLVLYEMITGKRAFDGASPASVIAAIMERPAPSIANVAPPVLDRVLQRCLAKDPDERWQSVRDLKAEIEWIANTPAIEATSKPARSRSGWIAAVIATLAALTLGAMLWAPWRSAPDPPKVVRFQITAPEPVVAGVGFFALSPDGSKLVYDAVGSGGILRVWLRSMDTLESRPLPGTENPTSTPMFWSFDSRFVLLGMVGKVKKVDVNGGPPTTLGDTSGVVVGGTGNRAGVILFGLSPGVIQRVALSGGAPSAVTALNAARNDYSHTYPVFLPDGRHFLYLVHTAGSEASGIYLGSIGSRPEQQDPKRLIATDFAADFVPFPDGNRGAILFYRAGTLLAQPFDLRRLETVGEATPVAEQLGSRGGFGFFSASVNGTLVYRGASTGDERLGWLDRQGNRLGMVGEPHQYSDVAISPDEKRVALGRIEPGRDIWLTDFAHASDTRFTFDPATERNPVWSPDGSRIAFSSNRLGTHDLYQHASNGSGQDELLFKSDHLKFATDWSRDGRYLLYFEPDPKSKRDLWVLPMDPASSGRKPMPFLRTDFDELNGKFSPDSHWVAYQSDESGRYEIYVRPFPAVEVGGKWMVSHGGGSQPHWRGDGKELFYMGPDSSLMAVPVSASGAAFQPGTPAALFKAPLSSTWDVTADGKRFLFPIPSGEATQTPFTVVQNWTSLLKR